MVSVVMAVYNGAEYLEKQLDSIRCQTTPPDEVIMCDDQSTDNTVGLVRQYIEKYGLSGWRIYENENNIGYYYNFFKAIFLSKGDTIYLSDQDDIWDKRKIEAFESIYHNHPEIMMIQSNISFIDNIGNPIRSKNQYHGIKNTGKLIKLDTESMCRFPGFGFTMSFRRAVADLLETNAFYKHENIYKFHDILIGLTSAAIGDCYLEQSIVDKHRLHIGNATQKFGSTYISDRTKEKQLTILERRIKEYDLLSEYCIDNNKKDVFNNFRFFAQERKAFIKKHSLKHMIYLIRNNKFYSSKLGLVTDMMYSLGMEKLLLFLYKRI